MRIVPYLTVFLLILRAAAQDTSRASHSDYDINLSSYEERPFEYSLLFEFIPSLQVADDRSPLARLRYGSTGNPLFDSYLLRSEGALRFSKAWFTAFASGSAGLGCYRREDSLSYPLKLYEAYAKAASGTALSFTAGKQNLKWGKGYVYSPVSFTGRRKDISDMDATLEGYWMVSAEYIKAAAGPLETFAATLCLLPSYREFNDGYAPDRTASAALQLYILLLDTDIDVYGRIRSDRDYSAGFDVSRNVLPNIELHADIALTKETSREVFTPDMNMAAASVRSWELLAGVRLLTPFNTTIISEYLYRSAGYSGGEMDTYRSALGLALERDPADPFRKTVVKSSLRNYTGQFVMHNYLYLKLSQPDLFSIVYFNPAAYCLLNIDDFSCMAGVELPYTRFEHASILLRYAAFAGKHDSEYGMKPLDHRLELRVRLMW